MSLAATTEELTGNRWVADDVTTANVGAGANLILDARTTALFSSRLLKSGATLIVRTVLLNWRDALSK